MITGEIESLGKLAAPGGWLLTGPGIDQIERKAFERIAGNFQCRLGFIDRMNASKFL